MKKPACLTYGMTPRLIPIEAAASYCSMSVEDFRDFYSGRSIRSRTGKELYDVKLIDTWLDQRSAINKGATDPKTLLKGLGCGKAKGAAANVG